MQAMLLTHDLQARLRLLPCRIAPCLQGRADQVGVALGRPDLGMSQPPPDHFQRNAAGNPQGRECVAQFVDANIKDVGLRRHSLLTPSRSTNSWSTTSPGKTNGQPFDKASLPKRISAMAFCEIGMRWTGRCLVYAVCLGLEKICRRPHLRRS